MTKDKILAQIRAAIDEQMAGLQTELVISPHHRRPDLQERLEAMQGLAKRFAPDPQPRAETCFSRRRTCH